MEYPYEVSYPKGGSNKMWEPIHIKADIGVLTGLTLQARTWTRNGCEIALLDEDKEELGNYKYSYLDGLGYHNQMAKDIARDMNIVFQLTSIKAVINHQDLLQIMEKVRSKCESRLGNRLPDSEYEALVSFA